MDLLAQNPTSLEQQLPSVSSSLTAVSMPQLHEMQPLSAVSPSAKVVHDDHGTDLKLSGISHVPDQLLQQAHSSLSHGSKDPLDSNSFLSLDGREHHHHHGEDSNSLANSAASITDGNDHMLPYFGGDSAVDVFSAGTANSATNQQIAAAVAAYPSIYNPNSSLYNHNGSSNGYFDGIGQAANSLTSGTASPPPTSLPAGHLLTYGGTTYLIHSSAAGGPVITPVDVGAESNNNASKTPNIGLNTNFQANTTPTTSESSSNNQKNANLSYATRVAPGTIQWLIANYETAEGVSLPRSTLYDHYTRHCSDSKQEPVNAASFGKLIRSVFLGLKTRRIGTRGNSKYHYYGIRVKPSSPLSQLEDVKALQQKVQHPVTKKKGHGHISSNCQTKDTTNACKSDQGDNSSEVSTTTNRGLVDQVGKYFGSTSSYIPGLKPFQISKEKQKELDINPNVIEEFCEDYIKHSISVFEAVTSLNFNWVEKIWMEFWKNLFELKDDHEEKENIVKIENSKGIPDVRSDPLIEETSNEENPEGSRCNKLMKILSLEETCQYIERLDLAYYNKIVEFLMPHVLKSIPNALTQSIRNFAKNLDTWMVRAIEKVPVDVRKSKIKTVNALSQILRRYTGLNHLAQAARAVMYNSSQISQMLTDLNRVDFNNVQQQASWICQCDPHFVKKLENQFKDSLQSQSNLENWSEWLDEVVQEALEGFQTPKELQSRARKFLLNWSFYNSLVIRDLTLRSAASFGSFHLIRLLYDEFMFYLVEKKVAKSLKKTSVEIVAENIKKIKGSSAGSGENHASEELNSKSTEEEKEALNATFDSKTIRSIKEEARECAINESEIPSKIPKLSSEEDIPQEF